MDTENGTLTTKKISDKSLIGRHDLTFVAFLMDIDPSALHSHILPLKLSMDVVNLSQNSKDVQ